MRVRLDVILSADKVIWYLGTFAFVASHIFFVGGRHLSAAAGILHHIERLEELHTKM